MPNNMEGLLKWSIDAAHTGKMDSEPDPKMLAQLLGAPDDVTIMREELRLAVESTEKPRRIECLEAFEEHVENVDNANNMGALWDLLLFLVKDSDEDIRALALSCVAAAVQNNAKSQADLVATKSGVSSILDTINDPSEKVATKGLLALSCAIGHCEAAYDQFVDAKGWNMFSQVFSATFETDVAASEKIRSRVLSLLFAIVLLAPNTSVHDNIDRLGLIDKLRKTESTEHSLIREKIDHILSTLKDNPRAERRLLTQV